MISPEHNRSCLQIGHAQCEHVQSDDVTWSGEIVVRVKLMAEFWLGEELLLRNRSETHTQTDTDISYTTYSAHNIIMDN